MSELKTFCYTASPAAPAEITGSEPASSFEAHLIALAIAPLTPSLALSGAGLCGRVDN